MNGLAARVRGTSPHTIQSYRDSLVLLLRFVATQTQRSVHQLDLDLARRLGRAAVAVWLRSTAAIRKLLRRPPPDVDLEADRAGSTRTAPPCGAAGPSRPASASPRPGARPSAGLPRNLSYNLGPQVSLDNPLALRSSSREWLILCWRI